LCLAGGFDPHVTFESDDYETVQGLGRRPGVGVALVPRLAPDPRPSGGSSFRELSAAKPGPAKVVAATMSKPGVAPAARRMIKILGDGRRASTFHAD